MMLDLDGALESAMGRRDLVDAMRLGIDAFGRYRDALPFSEQAYTRSQLARTSEFELVAMVWAPGSRSIIHNHGDSRCWVVMLDGTLEVENFERLDDGGDCATLRHQGTTRIVGGDFDHRDNARELHRVANREHAPAYSLQLYAKPLSVFTTIVDERTGRCGTMQSTVDSIIEL